MSSLTFAGAARTVTGSKYILEHDGQRILIDCGLFQGLKELRRRNWDPFPVAPSSIAAVVLTHAHLDHVGYLPRLVGQGFSGPVFCTAGTAELSHLVLPDSARIQEEDARNANKHRFSKHPEALPLYTEIEAQRALTRLKSLSYSHPTEILPGVTIEFHQAGHLLGSAFVLVRLAGGATVLFGGDLGRYGRPVLPDPQNGMAADLLLIESTYGDREHLLDDDGQQLGDIIRDTAQRGGKLVIPSFAIGRVEEVLYWVKRLEGDERIPRLPVYVDSPMAIEALRFYSARLSELDPDMRPAEQEVSAFTTARFQTVASTQQSKELTASRKPAIVISSSGMATGGRVLHHLKAALPDPRNTVLFVGFQAAGTRGRLLVDGATEVRIHGQDVVVGARIAKIDSMSAHADRSELLRWLGTFALLPKQIALVHGEPGPMDALRASIQQRFNVTPLTPEHLQTISF